MHLPTPHLSLPSSPLPFRRPLTTIQSSKMSRRCVWVFFFGHNTSATLANYSYNLCTYMSSIVCVVCVVGSGKFGVLLDHHALGS